MDCILMVLLNAAMVQDMFEGKISNYISFGGLILGPLIQIIAVLAAPDEGGSVPSQILLKLLFWAAGVLVGFLIGMPLFAAGVFGGGDVKLLMMTLGFLGGRQMLLFICGMLAFALVGSAAALLRRKHSISMAPAITFAALLCLIGGRI